MNQNRATIFYEKVNQGITDKTLIRLILSSRRDVSSDLQRVIVTLVELKKGIRVNFVFRYTTRDVTKNFDAEEALDQIKTSLQQDFFNADLFTDEETSRLLVTVSGKIKIRTGKPEMKPLEAFSHDRQKHRIITTQNNIYLQELGILNPDFEVRHEMNDKFLQINRYIELLEPYIRECSFTGRFNVADMGSGKGYLTFALYDYLTGIPGYTPSVTGVESRKDMVDLSNRVAEKAGFTNLKFIRGTIRDAKLEPPDMLIALHACDTATDDAIFRGIKAGSSLIVCAPCCHKQIRKEFRVTGVLKPVTRHGILEERQAEIVTDAIRALILESHGYKTDVFEFISTEHTPKNVMIVGRKIRDHSPDVEKTRKRIYELKKLFGIEEHYLESLFVTRDA